MNQSPGNGNHPPMHEGIPPECRRLSMILEHAAQELFDAAALHDKAWMWEEARAIASRVLAACPMEPRVNIEIPLDQP